MTKDDKLFDNAIDHMIHRARFTLKADLDGFPHYADAKTGEWTTTPTGFWTGGFWPGMLWLAGYYSGDEKFWLEASDWTRRLESRVGTDSVFKGFLFYFSGGLGALLADNQQAGELAVCAAKSLQDAFNPRIGLIPLGSEAEEAHTVGENETNIDGLAASILMMWASRHTGDGSLKDIAIKHALKSGEYCIRENGSVCQSASFDGATGELIRNYTHKGFRESSTWTRAQAWAMLGYSYLASSAPNDPRLVARAEHVSDWWIRNIPEDLVAYWDFDAPREEGTKRDTSGTAIAAAALLKLAQAHHDRKAARNYYRFARETVKVLCRNYLTDGNNPDNPFPGILTQGCFDHTRSEAMNNELIWGDYFLFESLGIMTGSLPAGRV